MYQHLCELPTRYTVTALIKIEKVRATQILTLRKVFKDKVEFVSIKDRVAKKALESLNLSGTSKLADELTGQCMFLFTNMSPFRLNVLLGQNKIMLAARGGDIASVDVVVPAKNTGIAPGPMLTDFKEAGIQTKIDQGTIWIAKDSTPVHKGEVIGEKLASILGKLDIKPVEVGVSLYAALEDGMLYVANDLIVDVDATRDAIIAAHQEAVSLSIGATYVTPENATMIVSMAAQQAVSLSVESGFITNDTKEAIIQRATQHAKSLVSMTKDYTPSSEYTKPE